jgi:hypothetical protein
MEYHAAFEQRESLVILRSKHKELPDFPLKYLLSGELLVTAETIIMKESKKFFLHVV